MRACNNTNMRNPSLHLFYNFGTVILQHFNENSYIYIYIYLLGTAYKPRGQPNGPDGFLRMSQRYSRRPDSKPDGFQANSTG